MACGNQENSREPGESAGLDKYIEGDRIHQMEVRIVSGDNVEIRTIDGKKYGPQEK